MHCDCSWTYDIYKVKLLRLRLLGDGTQVPSTSSCGVRGGTSDVCASDFPVIFTPGVQPPASIETLRHLPAYFHSTACSSSSVSCSSSFSAFFFTFSAFSSAFSSSTFLRLLLLLRHLLLLLLRLLILFLRRLLASGQVVFSRYFRAALAMMLSVSICCLTQPATNYHQKEKNKRSQRPALCSMALSINARSVLYAGVAC